jgi:hypothetical protein
MNRKLYAALKPGRIPLILPYCGGTFREPAARFSTMEQSYLCPATGCSGLLPTSAQATTRRSYASTSRICPKSRPVPSGSDRPTKTPPGACSRRRPGFTGLWRELWGEVHVSRDPRSQRWIHPRNALDRPTFDHKTFQAEGCGAGTQSRCGYRGALEGNCGGKSDQQFWRGVERTDREGAAAQQRRHGRLRAACTCVGPRMARRAEPSGRSFSFADLRFEATAWLGISDSNCRIRASLSL